jgi:ATP-dependent Clp protease ATP-binding subunit ClpX
MKFLHSINGILGKTLGINELLEIGVVDPVSIVQDLDKYIIGQDAAKKSIALMLLNRSLLMLKKFGVLSPDLKLTKNNVLMLGPTGSGKTALIKAVAEISDIPIYIYDITSTTGAGYYGSDLLDMLNEHINYQYDYYSELYQAQTLSEEDFYNFSFDVFCKIVENSIIYIDEIDKIKITRDNSKKDGWGSMLQVELLKMIEGHNVNLLNDKTRQTEKTLNKAQISNLNTENIFFIAGGAFSGLDDIIKHRLKINNTVGFLTDYEQKLKIEKNALDFFKTEDLIEYGFMPEFIGRFPIKTVLQSHTVDTLKKIMTKAHGSVYLEYIDLFKVFGVKLKFSDEALTEIANAALKVNLGARALKSIFNEILEDKVFNIFHDTPGTMIISKTEVKKRLKL